MKMFSTVGYSRPVPASERRWKRVDGAPHLERHSTSFGIETRCRECGRKVLGYTAMHWMRCEHDAPGGGG